VVTWNSSHNLDPYKPLASNVKPLTIQVVALQWKWLFIYPEQGIATVNFAQIPEDVPINFEITSDAPMNSFWIPQLGGQIYAMPGMSTKLHLMAEEPGDYRGSSANISGEGYWAMRFTTRASSQEKFDDWVAEVKTSKQWLDAAEYKQLAKPSEDEPQIFYSAFDDDLYDTVVMKYMSPGMIAGQAAQKPEHNHEAHEH
jgi:cytochrome o ubiquinol oxidase subunit 2